MYTKHLGAIKARDVLVVGGKGAALGDMYRSGFRVPDAFVITTRAFGAFMNQDNLGGEIKKLFKTIRTEDSSNIQKVSKKIIKIILAKKLPKDLEKEILNKFKELGAKYVAVRSSATKEDGAEHAWAGQLDSFLNTAEKDLLHNTKRAFASLFSPRAIHYRFEKGLENANIAVAVVIQTMVQSEISGVAFSTHPISKNPDQILVEAGYGLGEAVVSGTITPDSFVYSKKENKVIDKQVNQQNKKLVLTKKGNVWKKIATIEQKKQKINDENLDLLFKEVLKIEKHFKKPCDVEWAIYKGELFILQSRPITTLKNNVQTNLEKYEKYNDKNYDLLWRVYTYFPFCYLLWSQDYKEHDFIFIYKNDQYFAFVNKKTRDGLSRKAVKLYHKDYKNYEKSSRKIIAEAHAFYTKQLKINFKKLKHKEFVREAKMFIKMSEKILKPYFVTEFFHTDHVADIIVNKPKHKHHNIIKENSQKMGELKLDMRAAWNYLATTPNLLKKFVDEFSARLQVVDSAFYMSFQEMIISLENNQFMVVKKNRNLGFIWGKKFGETGLYGENVERILNNLWKVDLDALVIDGQVGNPGVVYGKVKKIDYEDYNNYKGKNYLEEKFKEMKQGDVLVTNSTSPEFIPACKKACAIVTDEGGIISHAAIVARELGIPAVIGTKNATLMLRDGDEILVDATKGQVKIIQKASK